MHITRLRTCCFVLLGFILLCGRSEQAWAQQVTPDRLYAWVDGISGKDPAGRRAFVLEELRISGVPFRELPFDTTLTRRGTAVTYAGTNIVATLGKGEQVVVVGAHYDAVPNAPGANDNGAGVAVLLGLANSLKEENLGVTLQICFFDQEEVGLIGSSVYAREYVDPARHLAMVNLDVVGFGSEVAVGPVGEGDDDLIAPLITTVAASQELTWNIVDVYPPSDHRSFAAAGLENISVSIVPEGDTERMVKMLRGAEMNEQTIPVVLKTMHTPQDGPETIEPEAVMTVYRLMHEVILRLSAMD